MPGILMLILINMMMLSMCVGLVKKKVQGSVFMLIFWSIIIVTRIFFWIEIFLDNYKINYDLTAVTDSKYYIMAVSVGLSLTIIMWLFNVQKVKKIKYDEEEQK